jgi:hypothetical protein
MPRKGHGKVVTDKRKRNIKTKGSIVTNNGHFRAQFKILDHTVAGPAWRDRSRAVRDLVTARSAGSEQKMRRVLERMKDEAAKRRLEEEPGLCMSYHRPAGQLPTMEYAQVDLKWDALSEMPRNDEWMGPIGDENVEKIMGRHRMVWMVGKTCDSGPLCKYTFADTFQVNGRTIYKYVGRTTGKGLLVREVGMSRLVLTITTENTKSGKMNVIATSMTGDVVYGESYDAEDICRCTEYYSKLKEFLVENNVVTKSTTVSIIDTDGEIHRGYFINSATFSRRT